jgi:hypothetical protein
MECAATGTFDVCYPTKLIEKAAVIQKLIKLIVDEAIKQGDANVAESKVEGGASIMRPSAFRMLYANHEYLNWLQ